MESFQNEYEEDSTPGTSGYAEAFGDSDRSFRSSASDKQGVHGDIIVAFE